MNLLGIAFQQLIVDVYQPVVDVSESDVQMSVDEIHDLLIQLHQNEYILKAEIIPLLILNGYKSYNTGGVVLWLFKSKNNRPVAYLPEGVL